MRKEYVTPDITIYRVMVESYMMADSEQPDIPVPSTAGKVHNCEVGNVSGDDLWGPDGDDDLNGQALFSSRVWPDSI